MHHPRSHPLARAVVLLGALTLGQSAIAQPPDDAKGQPAGKPITVRVELVVDSLPENTRSEVQAELSRQLEQMAGELGFVQAESEAAVLILRVQFGQPDPSNPLYIMDSVALHEGRPLDRAEGRTCFRCTPAELVKSGLELLPEAVAQAVASQPEPIAEPVPPPTIDANDVAAQDISRTLRLGPATYVGISVGGLGLVSVIAGGVLLERGIRPRDADPLHLTVINSAPPGAALLGVGLASMVAGVILIGVDGWIIAPRRAGRSRATLSQVAITADGFMLAGRF
jgi:hypothetical protein